MGRNGFGEVLSSSLDPGVLTKLALMIDLINHLIYLYRQYSIFTTYSFPHFLLFLRRQSSITCGYDYDYRCGAVLPTRRFVHPFRPAVGRRIGWHPIT